MRHWIERANVLAECIDRFPESYDAVWLGDVLARSAMDALIGSLAVALVVTLVLRRTRSIA